MGFEYNLSTAAAVFRKTSFLCGFARRGSSSNPSFSVQEKKFLQSRGFFSCVERGVTRAPVRRVAGALRRCRVKDEGGALRASHVGALSERKSTGRRASLEAGRVQIPVLRTTTIAETAHCSSPFCMPGVTADHHNSRKCLM